MNCSAAWPVSCDVILTPGGAVIVFIDMMSRAIGQGRLMAVHGMFNGEYVCTDMGHSKKSCDWGCIQTYYDFDDKLNTRNLDWEP